MKTPLLTLLTAATVAFSASAAPLTFDFKDPKGVNNAVFKLDAPLEQINGTASGVSGTVSFDPANPSGITGKIIVAAKSLTVGNSMMQDHMHGDKWLDVAKHPEISFEIGSVKNTKTTGDVTTADVTGKFSLKGVTKELTVVRANFTLKRSDFNIQPGQNEDKVSNDIEINLAVAGAAPKG
jgi:polyisoprenoid-binding protein YceI